MNHVYDHMTKQNQEITKSMAHIEAKTLDAEPNCALLRRVQTIMEKDRALKKQLGANTHYAVDHHGNKHWFCSETIQVATALLKNGSSSSVLQKSILRMGQELLIVERLGLDGEVLTAKSVSDSIFSADPQARSAGPRGKTQNNNSTSIDQNQQAQEAQKFVPAGNEINQKSELASVEVGPSEYNQPVNVVLPALAEERVIEIKLSEIDINQGIQCRAAIDKQVVADYAQRMKDGDIFPPMVVFDIDGVLVLVDGFHRLLAAKRAELKTLRVDVRRGDRKEATRFAVGANAIHGFRWNNDDKRHAVEMILRESQHLSDHTIARLCKVSQPFVGKIRRKSQTNELKTVISSEVRIGRDGKRRRQSVSRIKTSDPSQPMAHPMNDATGPSTTQERESRVTIEKCNGPNSVEFVPEEEWETTKILLNTQLVKWPANYRAHLARNLHQFADSLC